MTRLDADLVAGQQQRLLERLGEAPADAADDLAGA